VLKVLGLLIVKPRVLAVWQWHSRPVKSHTLGVRLTHLRSVSRSHASQITGQGSSTSKQWHIWESCTWPHPLNNI